MNETKTTTTARQTVRKPAKQAKTIVEATITLKQNKKTTSYKITLTARNAHGELVTKEMDGKADVKPMSAALEAVKGALKGKNLHLNIKHNNPEFQQWVRTAHNAYPTLAARMGCSVFCKQTA